MKQEDIDKLKTQYINSAIQHGAASINGDYKVANKEYKKIQKVYEKICKSPEESREFFSSLLHHSDLHVKVWACSHALKLNILIDESLNELRNAESSGPGVASLAAKMTLKQWEKEGKLGGSW